MRKTTKLEFLNEIDKRIVKIRHSNDIKIFIENRKNHQKFYNVNNDLVDIYIDYIVILIPKNKVSLEDMEKAFRLIKRGEVISAGFEKNIKTHSPSIVTTLRRG